MSSEVDNEDIGKRKKMEEPKAKKVKSARG
jgi:hypothetical protein